MPAASAPTVIPAIVGGSMTLAAVEGLGEAVGVDGSELADVRDDGIEVEVGRLIAVRSVLSGGALRLAGASIS